MPEQTKIEELTCANETFADIREDVDIALFAEKGTDMISLRHALGRAVMVAGIESPFVSALVQHIDATILGRDRAQGQWADLLMFTDHPVDDPVVAFERERQRGETYFHLHGEVLGLQLVSLDDDTAEVELILDGALHNMPGEQVRVPFGAMALAEFTPATL